MKTKKTLKFSKETVILLDNTAKKLINGGNQAFASNTRPQCTSRISDCFC
ncbi:hypothetical protein [Chryseobacterium gallinarum]|uniref:Class I lanthipeptide n=1 Tax=Chryseobacterium gallinarum TaxID=1324352 RepID=A0ABX6KPT0_CHRGL|nr:hypothetical protein [Chryseobacterium gallinarum]QIY89839.1 hypothetical protein FOB44_03835 [Chryseobacterium gallinarum]